MAGETQGDGTAHRSREAQFQQAPQRVGLHDAALPAEVVESNQLSV